MAQQESVAGKPNQSVKSAPLQPIPAEPPKNLIDFVNGFRHRLFVAGGMARDKLQMSQGKIKKNYDRHTEQREFSPGDQVLALMPIVGSPFQARYTGPYTVIEKLSDLNYFIATPGRRKSKQLCHINLLKPLELQPC